MANTHNMDTQWCNIATLQHYNMIMLMTMIMILIIAIIIIMIIRSASKASHHYLSQGAEQSHWPSIYLFIYFSIFILITFLVVDRHKLTPVFYLKSIAMDSMQVGKAVKLSPLGFEPRTFFYPGRLAFQYTKSSCWFLICQATKRFLSLITTFITLGVISSDIIMSIVSNSRTIQKVFAWSDLKK